MTYEETRSILTVLKINYPQSFKNWEWEQGEAFLNLWSEAFKDDPVQMVAMAVKAIIYSDTREFAPNIGQVKDRMVKLSNSMTLDADQAWAMVYKALSNSIYNAESEFNKLPSEVRAGVGSASQLREWAQMDTATLESVIASNFKKGFRGRVQERLEFEKLPTKIQTMIQGLTDAKRID